MFNKLFDHELLQSLNQFSYQEERPNNYLGNVRIKCLPPTKALTSYNRSLNIEKQHITTKSMNFGIR